MIVREATTADAEAIRSVERAAFGRDDEADLAGRLRDDGSTLVELVACEADQTIGHVLFSALPIVRDGATVAAAALAPLAVRPESRRRGVGGALVRAGVAACREAGMSAVVVLGDAAYYGRFGFRPETASTLRAPFSGPHFMALELAPGALAGGGEARYAPAFGL